MSTYRLTDEALQDLDEIFNYLSGYSLDAGDRTSEVTESLTWGPGQSIRTETFMLFIHSYRPNAVAPTGLKKTID